MRQRPSPRSDPHRGHEDGFTLVELLVVVSLVAVFGASVVGVVLTSHRATQRNERLATVMNDGRLSLDRMSLELRAARRINTTSDASTAYFWVDQNQDDLQQVSELITYQVQTISGGSGNRYQVVRWTDAEPSDDRVIARTLLNDEVFSYSDEEGAVLDPATANLNDTWVVQILLDLQVESPRAPNSLEAKTTVRLRNVGNA